MARECGICAVRSSTADMPAEKFTLSTCRTDAPLQGVLSHRLGCVGLLMDASPPPLGKPELFLGLVGLGVRL